VFFILSDTAIAAYHFLDWKFLTIEIAASSSENPFENGINDVPLNVVCRTIEID
jgi:putative membrane protein